MMVFAVVAYISPAIRKIAHVFLRPANIKLFLKGEVLHCHRLLVNCRSRQISVDVFVCEHCFMRLIYVYPRVCLPEDASRPTH